MGFELEQLLPHSGWFYKYIPFTILTARAALPQSLPIHEHILHIPHYISSYVEPIRVLKLWQRRCTIPTRYIAL